MNRRAGDKKMAHGKNEEEMVEAVMRLVHTNYFLSFLIGIITGLVIGSVWMGLS